MIACLLALIMHIRQADNGWWIGTNARTGALGLFPGGFVEVLKA